MARGFTNSNLSIALNNILDSYGLDEDTRRKIIECRKMEQMLMSWESELEGRIHIFLSGSYYEVTTVNGLSSDVDRMFVESKIRVIDDINKWKPDTSVATFMMDTDGCYKAFYKLFKMSNDYPGPLYGDVSINARDYLQNYDYGRIMLISDVKCFLGEVEKHGPALTKLADDIDDQEKDFVLCLRCDSFPREAANWKQRQTSLTRSRVGAAIIDQATHCYLVGVGNKGSVSEHLQWRLSFSHIENELIHAWNNTVVKCYIMMKFIKKDLIEPVVPDILCSYHFKTILMWMKEEYPIEFFVPTNLENCLVTCLRNVLWSVKNRSLPHYFVEGCNLFINKINEEARDLLVSVLKNILETWPNSLFQLKRRKLGYVLQQTLNLRPTIHLLFEDEDIEDNFSLERSVRNVSSQFIVACNVTDQNKTPKEILQSFINLLNLSKCVTWCYQEESREFIAYMLKDALCQFGLYLIQRSRRMSNKQMYCYRKSGSGLIRTYINDCGIHTTLRIIEHLLPANYQWALKALEIAEHKADIQRNVMKGSSTGLNFYKRHGEIDCTVFDQDDITHTPKGLAYEVINACVTTDPKISILQHPCIACSTYIYYLKFICFNALGRHTDRKVALDNMIRSSKDRCDALQIDKVNCNIIGHCYSVLGEARKAYREYRKSLVFWRHHNAALWHLAVLLRNRIQNRQH